MKITVKAPGSCGELVQGKIKGVNFLVTCPVNLYSQVSITKDASLPTITLAPKMQLALSKTLHYLGVEEPTFSIQSSTQMPLGKGMASSSADISAICQCVALSLGKNLTPNEIADIALSIEPTDGVFYSGISMFDHRFGQIRQTLGEPPPISIAIFDVGGEVDTLLFNQRQDLDSLNEEKELQVSQALALVIEGLQKKDIHLIGRGATLSALANQRILYKAPLEELIDSALSLGAVGVNIAHSGTVAGVLFSPSQQELLTSSIDKISKIKDITYLTTVSLISGGLLVQRSDNDEWEKCI